MAANTLLKKLLDAGMQFTETSQASAEKLVSDLVKKGEVRRKDAEKTVQLLVDRGRSSSEHVLGSIQHEVSRQVSRFAERLDGIESRIEELAAQVGLSRSTPAAKKAPAAK